MSIMTPTPDCPTCLPLLDDLLDGRLPEAAARRVETHVAHCPACAAELAARRALLAALRELAATPVPEGFEQRVLDRVLRPAPALRLVTPSPAPQPQRPARRAAASRWPFPLAAGLAAGFAALATALLVSQPASPPPAEALEAVQAVRVMFNSPDALRDVRIELHLPPGVRLASHAGSERVVSWNADLVAGPNLLELPIVIDGARDGAPLTTRLFHEGRQRDFSVPIPGAGQGAFAPPAPMFDNGGPIHV